MGGLGALCGILFYSHGDSIAEKRDCGKRGEQAVREFHFCRKAVY
jgi:hypothetical protein